MWESTIVPAVETLNQAELVLVPCDWCAETFAASGVARPIRVVPLGMDPAIFHPTADPLPLDPLIFGCAGRIHHGGMRKGIQEVADSFRAAFPLSRSDVRLHVKIWPDDPPLTTGDDPRIEVLRDPLTAAGLAGWYRGLSVFVSMSKGEGFGLQPLQAMACGRPVLAGFHSGHRDYLSSACAWELPCHPEPAQGVYAGLGDWYRTDPDDLVSALRAVATTRPGSSVGAREAACAAAPWTWHRAGAALHAVLTEFGFLAAPVPAQTHVSSVEVPAPQPVAVAPTSPPPACADPGPRSAAPASAGTACAARRS